MVRLTSFLDPNRRTQKHINLNLDLNSVPVFNVHTCVCVVFVNPQCECCVIPVTR